jgi:hypothetical protein
VPIGRIIHLRALADPGYTIDRWFYNGVMASYPVGRDHDEITVQGPTTVRVSFTKEIDLQILTAVELRFTSRTNQTYQIQSSRDLLLWSNDGAEIHGDGSVHSEFRTTDGESRAFYRIIVTPGPGL